MWSAGVFLLLCLTMVHSDISYLKFLQYENYTIPDMDTICSYFPTAKGVSEKCGKQLEIVCRDPTLLMTVLDASSKFPYSGVGYSSRTDYGNFDQCLSIDHKYEGGRILGEHCGIGLVLPDLIENKTDYDSLYKLAVCRPNGCSSSDFNAIIEDLLTVPLGLFIDQSCSTVESNTDWTAGIITVVTIFLVIIGLMVLSTLYDLYLYKTDIKSAHPLLLSFSILTNGRKLLHISKHSTSKEQIEVFHGFRVISIMWVVAGHGLKMFAFTSTVNVPEVVEWQKKMYGLYMNTAPLSVDTFFFMSGFLLAFQYFKGKTRTFKEQVFAIPHIILHRYLRLTPALIMMFLVTITFYKHLGSGPMWDVMTDYTTTACTEGWWKMLLYIQNYYDFETICLGQTWYLSADMQMFVLSPLILIPLSLQLQKISFKNLMLECLVFYIFYTALILALKFILWDYHNEYDTSTRVINYSMGVWLGLFMRVKINKPFLYMVQEKWRSVINLLTWTIVLLGLCALGFCYQDQYLNHGTDSQNVFFVLMRPAYSIALSWITYSCYHGKGGFVNWILCRPIFQVLGRLTYCIYITHISVVIYYIGSVRTKLYFSDYNGFYTFCGHYTVSVILSVFWTLAFESPLIIIEKYLLGGSRRPKDNTPPLDKSKMESPSIPA